MSSGNQPAHAMVAVWPRNSEGDLLPPGGRRLRCAPHARTHNRSAGVPPIIAGRGDGAPEDAESVQPDLGSSVQHACVGPCPSCV